MAEHGKIMVPQRVFYFCICFLLVFYNCDAGTVSTNSNIAARIGFHPTDFECTYTVDSDESVPAGGISWQIESSTGSGSYDTFAEFSPPDAHGKLNVFVNSSTGSDFNTRAVLYDVLNTQGNTFTAKFRLNEIRCEDEGNFRCLVKFTNSSGTHTETSTISLAVTAPAEKPYHAPVPVPDIIEEGTKVQFSCTANVGKPPGNIEWWRFRHNQAVPDYLGELSTTPVTTQDVCVYNVTSLISAYTMSRDDDQSVFRCSVSNDLVTADRNFDTPHVDSQTIRVFYKVITPTIEVIPHTPDHVEGSSVILSCNAKGYPSPLIDNHVNYLLWTFTPKNGHGDDVILISNNGLLSLENLRHEDSGRYTCSAHNGFNGKTFSSSNHVDISVHPAHTPKPSTSTSTPIVTESTTVGTSSVQPTSEATTGTIPVTSSEVNQSETTHELVTGTSPGASTADCQNNPKIDCRMYNLQVTCDVNGKYYPWAKSNCPLYCGYCQVPTVAVSCEDKLPNCDEYLEVCSNHLYRLFREENCRKFCGICKDVDYIYAQPVG